MNNQNNQNNKNDSKSNIILKFKNNNDNNKMY